MHTKPMRKLFHNFQSVPVSIVLRSKTQKIIKKQEMPAIPFSWNSRLFSEGRSLLQSALRMFFLCAQKNEQDFVQSYKIEYLFDLFRETSGIFRFFLLYLKVEGGVGHAVFDDRLAAVCSDGNTYARGGGI
ncbi:MAG: hypothetical protein MRZ52_01135 [Oscillospiraceae bacterium]|nr:hypothetical protein [Oscillospiraceae bacterium]